MLIKLGLREKEAALFLATLELGEEMTQKIAGQPSKDLFRLHSYGWFFCSIFCYWLIQLINVIFDESLAGEARTNCGNTLFHHLDPSLWQAITV